MKRETNDTVTTYIAFTRAEQAENLDGVFKQLSKSFEIYMDETIHSAPGKPTSPKEAGYNDAKSTPPKPTSYSDPPKEADYLFELNVSAVEFLMELLGIYRARFEWIKSRLEDITSNPPNNTFRASDLKAKVDDYNDKIEDSNKFAREYGYAGHKQLERARSSSLMFIAIVLFIAVFEFVWVWYFLSDQLGLSTAIYASTVATTLVIVIAALCALSFAVTTADMSPMMRSIGYCSIFLCVLMFLFGIGLLSGLRADSTNEGMDLIIAGYQSMTKIDVFVTALINLGGFIFLTLEFKSFFWPYPLYGYGRHVKLREEAAEDITGIGKHLREELEKEQAKVKEGITVVTQHKGSMKEFEKGKLEEKIDFVKISVEKWVDSFRGEYFKANKFIREDGPYDVSSDDRHKGSLFDDEKIKQKIKHKIGEIEDLIEGLNKNKFYEPIGDYLIKMNEYENELKEGINEIDDITRMVRNV